MRNGFLGTAIVYLGVTISLSVGAFPVIPDPHRTPGSLCTVNHRDYQEDRYAENIPYCRRNVDSRTKKSIYRAYNIPSDCTHRYTIDHFIPLSIGGDNSVANLWPEHNFVKATRKNLEIRVFQEIRQGRISQQEAVDRIYHEKLNPARPRQGSDPCDRYLEFIPQLLSSQS